MIIRDVTLGDVDQISAFLKELTALGKRTRPDDTAFVRDYYVQGPDNICCTVADDDGEVLGFQSLLNAKVGNQWGVARGGGIIGTHIRPSAARRGVGRALFETTHSAARAAGLPSIDATISATNPEGLGYYEAMGFQTYRTPEGAVCKRFDVRG